MHVACVPRCYPGIRLPPPRRDAVLRLPGSAESVHLALGLRLIDTAEDQYAAIGEVLRGQIADPVGVGAAHKALLATGRTNGGVGATARRPLLSSRTLVPIPGVAEGVAVALEGLVTTRTSATEGGEYASAGENEKCEPRAQRHNLDRVRPGRKVAGRLPAGLETVLSGSVYPVGNIRFRGEMPATVLLRPEDVCERLRRVRIVTFELEGTPLVSDYDFRARWEGRDIRISVPLVEERVLQLA